MGHGQDFSLRQTFRFEPPTLGGLSQTMFPRLEALLQDTDNQEIIGYLSRLRSVQEYQSVMDYLLGETFGGHVKQEVLAFYAGKGPQLRFLYGAQQIQMMEQAMLMVFQVLLEDARRKRMRSWGWAVEAACEVDPVLEGTIQEALRFEPKPSPTPRVVREGGVVRDCVEGDLPQGIG